MFFQQIIAAVLLLIVNINANTVAVYNTPVVNNNTTSTSLETFEACSVGSAFTAPNNTSMLFRQIHPKYRNITPVTGRSECEGFRKVDSKVDWDLLVEPTDREAFLQSLVGFEINDEDWTDVTLKKAKGMKLFTLHAFFDRDEVEEFSNRIEVIGSRPNELRREPEDENASISTSLAYATRDYTPNLHNSNVTITEKNHSIHVIHTPDVLALWDAAEDTINFVKANPGKLCKFGKSLYDLVLARFKNRYMYPDDSKLDDLRIFDRARARISTTACSHSRATGNTEGKGAWILNLLEVGANKRPEHCLSSINDKTSPDRLQSFYFTTVAEYIDYPEYIRRLSGHQFCYRKDSRWYDWLDYFRQLNETELQAQLDQQNLLIESSPVPATRRGEMILVLVEANAPRQSTRASSTSQGRRSTRGSSTSAWVRVVVQVSKAGFPEFEVVAAFGVLALLAKERPFSVAMMEGSSETEQQTKASILRLAQVYKVPAGDLEKQINDLRPAARNHFVSTGCGTFEAWAHAVNKVKKKTPPDKGTASSRRIANRVVCVRNGWRELAGCRTRL